MVTKNYARWGAGIIVYWEDPQQVSGSIRVQDITGANLERTVPQAQYSMGTWSFLQSLFTAIGLQSLSTKNVSRTGMFFGKGTTPATVNDYKLEDIIEFSDTGLSVVSEQLKMMSDKDTLYTYIYAVKNNSTEPITISESGMISNMPLQDGTTFLWARDTFEPVTLQPGETRAFTMTIGLE